MKVSNINFFVIIHKKKSQQIAFLLWHSMFFFKYAKFECLFTFHLFHLSMLFILLCLISFKVFYLKYKLQNISPKKTLTKLANFQPNENWEMGFKNDITFGHTLKYSRWELTWNPNWFSLFVWYLSNTILYAIKQSVSIMNLIIINMFINFTKIN